MKPLPDTTGPWRPCDEAVALTFDETGGSPEPSCLRWRGSLWRVVGRSRHWSTWHALPVVPLHAGEAPTTRCLRADFWRFRAQADPVSPLACFEVRRADRGWRLVRRDAALDVAEQFVAEHFVPGQYVPEQYVPEQYG
ncbi:hypothetical protein ACX80I_08640 [Arthrobacter sp. MDT3-44]